MTTWAEKIKSARIALRQADEPAVSQEALARLLEKSIVTIHGWEHGKHEPRGYERERVIKRLAELVSRAGTRRSMDAEIKPCD